MLKKEELIKELAKKAALTTNEATRALDSFEQVIKEEVLDCGEIQIPNIGKFKLKTLSEKQGRNPKTGESISIPERNRVAFKASSKLKEHVNVNR